MIVVGIDPGAEAGLVAVEFPHGWRLDHARWIGSSVAVRGKGTMDADRDRRFRRLIEDFFVRHRADLAVIECPIDARPDWQVKTGFADKHKRRESPETRFLQGKHYDIAVQAVPDSVPCYVYPVKGRKGMAGWMGRRVRKAILAEMRLLARTLGCTTQELSEHERMALGVVAYHATEMAVRRVA